MEYLILFISIIRKPSSIMRECLQTLFSEKKTILIIKSLAFIPERFHLIPL